MGTDRIGVVNLRRMDLTPGLIAEGDQVVDLDYQLAELITLRDEGKIIGIGLSHVTAEQLDAALLVGVVCVQNIYNQVDRGDEAWWRSASRTRSPGPRTSRWAAGTAPWPRSRTIRR